MIAEKSIFVNELKISYKTVGSGPALLILHGWGRGTDSWIEVQEKLAQAGYKVAVPDLPGFGRSELPRIAWGVDSYVDFVRAFAENLNLGTFVLIGHSFGGQIALKFAHRYPEKIEKLVLVAPAAIRRKPGAKVRIIQSIAKAGGLMLSILPGEGLRQLARKVFAGIIGRSDYLEARGVKREIMQRALGEDLSDLFAQITTNTLLVWGDKDRPVPLEDAYVMKEHIPHASLQIIPGIGHRVHQEAAQDLVKAIMTFIRP